MLRELDDTEIAKMFAVVLAPIALIFVVWLVAFFARRHRRRSFVIAQADVDALPRAQANDDADAFLRRYEQRASPVSRDSEK